MERVSGVQVGRSNFVLHPSSDLNASDGSERAIEILRELWAIKRDCLEESLTRSLKTLPRGPVERFYRQGVWST